MRWTATLPEVAPKGTLRLPVPGALPPRLCWIVERCKAHWHRWLQHRIKAAPRQLRHVETLALGGRRTLLLVECDGQRFLISASADALSAPVPLSGAALSPRPMRTDGEQAA